MRRAVCVVLGCALSGCMLVGPDYVAPPVPTAPGWIETADPALRRDAAELSDWWQVFGDPVLDELVETAYRQNKTLLVAGTRVLEAQARRGVAIGGLFPQTQQGGAAYTRAALSANRANQGNPLLDDRFGDWQIGFDAAWELDIWGRFRRGIEAADADLLAAVATYDDVLVSLIAEVAANYVQLRTLQERLIVAHGNVTIQRRSYEIADAKFRNGLVTELDRAQAEALLRRTEATVPAVEAAIRQTQNTLCILLGIPPRDLGDVVGDALGPIPTAPAEVAVGIPADMLRRRPDVHRAERVLAAQSAAIGIATADLLPAFSLVGNISLTAEDFVDVWQGNSFEGFGGPTVRWAILNYGRIRNNIRVQDARYQQQIAVYEDTVLRAQQEVEDAIAGFLGSRREVGFLDTGVAASTRAVELANLQYREGTVDYVRVLNAQQDLFIAQERQVSAAGAVAGNLVRLYRALGGGWELRGGNDFVPDGVKAQMRDRTNWGGLLSDDATQSDVEEAETGTEHDRGWWRWRWWWPHW
jgi:NodT family efflux transporter outer membrane factor (OMF) lipoprotein